MAAAERKRRIQSLVQFALGLVILVLVNLLANARPGGQPLYAALDLTEEKRFTLTESTIEQLEGLEEPLLVRVLLQGDLPAPYLRLRAAVEEMLADFSNYNGLVEYEFVDPLAGDPEDVRQRQEDMAQDGIVPVSDLAQSAGERKQRLIYPYALVYYGNRQRAVPLLEAALPNVSIAQRLNRAESLLEFNLSRVIAGITDDERPVIGLTTGNGELPPIKSADLVSALREDYEVGPVVLDSFSLIPNSIRALLILKPTEPFSDFDAFKLDQYVMNGGRILWAVDNVGMDLDSLRGRNEFIPGARPLGQPLNDLFFRYGFRLDPVLALDMVSTKIPLITSSSENRPNLVPFPYHVLSVPDADQPIVQNLDPVDLRFPSVIEAVNEGDGLRKTVLLATSDRSRRQRLPSPIDLDVQRYSLEAERFRESDLPLALLLEGRFTSPYANRLTRANAEVLRAKGLEFRDRSEPTAMIVVSDGDVAANPVRNGNVVLPLGLNRFENFTYANKTFLLNAVAYLLDPDGVISARGKQVKLRLLDTTQASAEAGYWRFFNIGLPLLLLAAFGLLFNALRRRRYATKYDQ